MPFDPKHFDLVANGRMTPNRCRKIAGLPGLGPVGDVLHVPPRRADCNGHCHVGRAFALGFWLGVVCGAVLVSQWSELVQILKG